MMRSIAIISVISAMVAMPRESVARQCMSLQKYTDAFVPEVDNDRWLKPSEKNIIRIDKLITKTEIYQSFDCILMSALPEVERLFGASSIMLDGDIYQFPQSNFAYGSILVNKEAYSEFIKGKLSENMKVAKVTFDFSTKGEPTLQDIFAIIKTGKNLDYVEVINGKQKRTNRCFSCHKIENRSGFIFKSKYGGHRLQRAVRELPVKRY